MLPKELKNYHPTMKRRTFQKLIMIAVIIIIYVGVGIEWWML